MVQLVVNPIAVQALGLEADGLLVETKALLMPPWIGSPEMRSLEP
jgi:hypothetical protein